MPNYFAQLPAFKNPDNAELDFQPLAKTIEGVGTDIRQRRIDDRNAMHMARQEGRAGAAESRAAYKFNEEKGKAAIDQWAGIHQAIEAAPEAERGAMLERAKPMFSKLRGMIPEFDQDVTAEGVHPEDYMAIGKLLVGKARGYQDPLASQKTQAEITHLNQKNSVDEAIAKMLTGGDEQPQQAPARPPPMLQPQSYQGGPGPNPTGFQQVSGGNAMAAAGRGQPAGLQLAADEQPVEPGAEAGPSGPVNPGAVYSLPGNETINTPFGQMTRDRARKLGMGLAASGKGEAGKMMIDAASGGDQKMGKAAGTVNDKEEITATNQLGTLDRIKDQFKSEYLQIPTRFNQWTNKWYEKAGGTLPAKDKADLTNYTRFRQSSWHIVNKTLKDLSGTAVTETEAQRQMLDLPNPGKTIMDGDAPTEFAAKLKGSIDFAKSAVARARYLRSQGFTGKPWEAGVEVGDMPGIINKRGAEIEQQLRQQNPKADPSALGQAVDQRIKQEFGI